MKLIPIGRGGRSPIVPTTTIIAVVVASILIAACGTRGNAGMADKAESAAPAATQIPTTAPIILASLETGEIEPAPDAPDDQPAAISSTPAAVSSTPTLAAISPTPAAISPTPAATGSVAPVSTATAAPEPDPTSTPAAVATAAPTATPIATATVSPTAIPTAQPEPTATATVVRVPTATAVRVPTATATPPPGPTASATPTASPTVDSPPTPTPAVSTFTYVVTAQADRSIVELFDAPKGTPFTPTWNGVPIPATNPTVFGTPRNFRVAQGTAEDTWVQVQVFGAPNGTTAWVENFGLEWTSSNNLVQLNLSSSTISVFDGTQLLASGPLRHGRPSAPTPTGDGWLEYVANPGAGGSHTVMSFAMIADTFDGAFGGAIPALGLRASESTAVGPLTRQGGVFASPEIFALIESLPLGSRVHITN